MIRLTSDTGQFVPLWSSSYFPLNRAGLGEEIYSIHLAEKVLKPPEKHDFFPSGMTFSQLSYALQTWKDFRWDISSSSLLLQNNFSLYWIDFSLCWIDFRCVSKLTSICVETTLYRNNMMRCTLESIQHGRRVTRKNVLVSYIIGVLHCKKKITLLL